MSTQAAAATSSPQPRPRRAERWQLDESRSHGVMGCMCPPRGERLIGCRIRHAPPVPDAQVDHRGSWCCKSRCGLTQGLLLAANAVLILMRTGREQVALEIGGEVHSRCFDAQWWGQPHMRTALCSSDGLRMSVMSRGHDSCRAVMLRCGSRHRAGRDRKCVGRLQMLW